MPPILRTSALLALFILAVLPVLAADPRPDGWEGMVLDVSRAEDAIQLFGQPAKDKDKVFLNLPRTMSWLSDTYKQKTFRTLTYKKLHGYKTVEFSFLDGTLVAIAMEAPNGEYEDKWVDPDDLEGLFATVFKPSARKNVKLAPPAEFVANAPTELKKSDYDYAYDMIALTEKSLVISTVDNYRYQSGLFDSPDVKRRKKIDAHGTRYPGFVSSIQVVSLRLMASRS
jgi:hypothetical protein